MRAGSALGQRGEPKRQRAPRAAVSSGGALCGLADNWGRREASGGTCPRGVGRVPLPKREVERAEGSGRA